MTATYLADMTAGANVTGSGFAVGNDVFGGHGLPVSIPTEELIFWTRTWRDGEAESIAARASGDVREFASGREAVRWLLSDD
jgi:hypothetical protein